MDPRGGSTELHEVYRSWLASRPDLSAKVRRGYQDNGRLRIEPRCGRWQISKIDHDSIQSWVNDMTTAWLGPRTVRWTHSVLKMTLDYSADAGRLIGRNPASRTKFPPMRPTAHTYLSAAEVAHWQPYAAIKVMSSSSSPTPGCDLANSPASTSKMWASTPAASASAAR